MNKALTSLSVTVKVVGLTPYMYQDCLGNTVNTLYLILTSNSSVYTISLYPPLRPSDHYLHAVLILLLLNL